jgi:hypothetical protein
MACLAYQQAGFAVDGRRRPEIQLRRGLSWLVRQQGGDGLFARRGARRIHAQAAALTALSDALRLTERRRVRERIRPVVERAATALIKQQTASGSWGGDAELTAMALLATSSARAAGLGVEARAHRAAIAWMRKYESRYREGIYAVTAPDAPSGKSAAYATVAKLLTHGGGGRLDRARANERLRTVPVVWGSGEFYRWYAATLAAYRLDGELWRQKWKPMVVLNLVPRQRGWPDRGARRTVERGSWPAHGACEKAGSAYTTSLAVLTLTATCGHAPVYGGGN